MGKNDRMVNKTCTHLNLRRRSEIRKYRNDHKYNEANKIDKNSIFGARLPQLTLTILMSFSLGVNCKA